MQSHASADKEPDIVAELLRTLAEFMPDLPQDMAQDLEARLREDFGGQRTYIPKRRRHHGNHEKQQIYQDGLGPESTEQITQRHKISRATLYRHMKRFGG